MLAIPSPDVLLNLFASAGQMLGLLALAMGGGVFVKKRSSVGGATGRSASRWPFFVCLGLLVGVSSTFLLYHLRVQDQQNQRLRANLVRKSTEGDQAVGDTSLKTLSFSGQSKHPRGVTTDVLDGWIAAGRGLNLIDVRETEEVEMGAIADSWARRYPDLQADGSGLVVDGKETVLLCESGNRSSELCDWFFARGISTHFMVGGYEKWVAEYRAMTGQRADGAEIRATPDYPQKQILLDTPVALDLFTAHGAVFVDVRYPEDFARGHLPGAINMPLRKMRYDEAEAALRALPARPIIAACYDKRSSFYGLLLGLKLHRMGADFRGRYTVPHEFTLPTAEAAWVARWKEDREGTTLFGLVGASVGSLITWFADRMGLLLAILVLVLLLRTAMLPFSLYSERDQWAQRRLAPKFASWKQQWAHDPDVWRRQSLRALRQAGVSPLRNIVGALLQIGLFAAAFAGVDAVAAARPTPFLWFDLSAADPLCVLPLLFGAVTFAFVRPQQQNKRRWLVPVVFVVVMVGLVWSCRAGVQVYLMASLGLMALQTILQRRWLDGRERPVGPVVAPPAPTRLVPLEAAAEFAELGNKAVHLGRLLQARLPVPGGFVVPTGMQCEPQALLSACASAGIESAAVRSSVLGEDGAESSMAGMFLTELDVEPTDLASAIERVRASYGGREGGVVVQAFRSAQYAGVLFTIDPAHAGRMLVELVKGCGEALVSGRATPKSFRFRRVTGTCVEGAEPPIPLQELIELGRRVEQLFGGPQDIEWVFVDGRFQLVQARAITRLPGRLGGDAAVVEAERHRLLQLFTKQPASEPVLEQTELSELLPTPTAYSLALFGSLWEAGGSVDRACCDNGFPYDVGVDDAPMVVTAFGRCFVDVEQRRGRSSRALGAAASFRMATSAQAIEQRWCAGQPAQRRRVMQLAAIDPARLPESELVQLCEEVRRHFVEVTYAEAETINIAAHFFVGAARRRAERAGLDAAALLRDPHGNVVSRAFAGLGGNGREAQRIVDFLGVFGHRAVHDFELAEPRYAESPRQVAAMVYSGTPNAGASRTAPAAESSPAASLPRLLQAAVSKAHRFQALKEEAKHEALRELAVLRGLLRHAGVRFGLGDAVFELTPVEVSQLVDEQFRRAAVALTAKRAERKRLMLAVEVSTTLSPVDLERLGEPPNLAGETKASVEGLRGACVAGSREVVGRVRVVHSPEQLSELQAGEILVARCTDPCWLGAFGRAGGLVTEIGGWLSHAAIQAREHDLATIVGVPDATRQLRSGDVVRLGRDGSIVLIPERRRQRQTVDLPAELHFADRVHMARIHDVSTGGACIEVAHPASLPAEAFEMRIGDEVVQASLAWRNCRRAGVKFDTVSPTVANMDPVSGAERTECLSEQQSARR
ncbi:MAG: PEP/pyruvate-binding domain-containing protein [Planctomycetota bacterium]